MIGIYARRRAANFTIMALSLLATATGLIVLFLILWSLLRHGVPALSVDFFTKNTPAPGNVGGLLNAIYGSFILTLVGTAVGAPVGVLTGTFLAEFARGSRLAPVVRFINDILLSSPSIVIGLFVYAVMVARMGHLSAWAGAASLAIILVPVVVRTTENMLTLVPASLREAAVALGAPQWKVIVMVVYRAAMQGMLTGIMLGVARIAGETAPLLFTAFGNNFWSTDMNAPMANLPMVIFQFALSPYADWQVLAWGGALLITLAILVLNITARVIANWSSFGK